MATAASNTNIHLSATNVHDGTPIGAIGQTYNNPENRNPSNWDGVMKASGLGNFVFTNYVPDQPLDFSSTRKWDGWTDVDKCKICAGGPYSTTYEVDLEWDTGKHEHIREVCIRCLNQLNSIVRNKQTNKEWIRVLS